MNTVGVPPTPASRPAAKSASTLSPKACAASPTTRLPSIPSSSAYARSAASSSRSCRAKISSCMGQKAPCSPAASAARAAVSAKGCTDGSGKLRNSNRTCPSDSVTTCRSTGAAAAQYGHS